TGAVGVQQRGQGSPANGVCSGGKEVAARHVQNKLIEGIHREGPPFPPLAALHRLLSRKRQSTHRYLFSTSSRFISWLTTIVQAASVAVSSEGSAFDSPTAINFFAFSGCAL